MKFNTLDEATEYIINKMRDSEKDIIKQADTASIHMALARWANTQYVSNDNYNIQELVIKQLNDEDTAVNEEMDDKIYLHNDNVVAILIDRIIEKLKN